MSKLDYEKDRRKQKSKVRAVKKTGAETDFAGEDGQDELVSIQAKNTKLSLPKDLAPKFKVITRSLSDINNQVYSGLNEGDKIKFLRELFEAHNDLYFFGNCQYGYDDTDEFRVARRFLESVMHLIDEKKYWDSR